MTPADEARALARAFFDQLCSMAPTCPLGLVDFVVLERAQEQLWKGLCSAEVETAIREYGAGVVYARPTLKDQRLLPH